MIFLPHMPGVMAGLLVTGGDTDLAQTLAQDTLL
jgi:hypothetical protein